MSPDELKVAKSKGISLESSAAWKKRIANALLIGIPLAGTLVSPFYLWKHPPTWVETSSFLRVHASVRSLLDGSLSLGSFDLVYSAGLYDYLQPPTAVALTSRLMNLVKPGGRLLLSNFLPTTPDIGYMECCMGWALHYRTSDELTSLSAKIPVADVADCRVWESATRSLGYLEIQKAC